MYYLPFAPEATTAAAYKTLTKNRNFLPMSLSSNLALLIIGTGIGLGIAMIGAFSEYWRSFRSSTVQKPYQLPGCMLFVIGGLSMAGIVSLIISFFLNGSIKPALVLGAGVLGGFYVGFGLLFILWLLIKR